MIHSSPLAAKSRLLPFVLLPLFVLLALFARPSPGAAQDPVLPAATPQALPGLELFAERCANCHGEGGQGDGPLIQQAGATAPMPFDAAYIRETMPSVMFRQITDGEAAVGMPPFGPASSNPIDEAGRWNLVAAVFSLATPPEDVTAGQIVYEDQCATCHGDTGAGDGPDAAASDPPASSLVDVTYWFNRSNQTVFEHLSSGEIAAHDFEIGEEELRRAIDYARTFSYAYTPPDQLDAPIPQGVIAGSLTNGATGTALSGVEVQLRAFTPQFEETLTLTSTTDAAGSFQFEVSDVPPDWVFIAGSTYEGLNFSSAADQLGRESAALDLPITVYDKTSDSSGINVAQLHIVMEFAEEMVEVSQLYVINNDAQAVYVGPTGDPTQGVFTVAVPEGAQNLQFLRTFGAMDSFLPATDFVPVEGGWADPLPLRPGPGALSLLVRYDLPFSSGMTIAHPIFYRTATSTIILPDSGVTVANLPWVEQPPQNFGQAEMFLNFVGPGVPAGETITIELEGRPSVVTGSDGTTVVRRDQMSELLIGGGALLLSAVAGIFLWRTWQRRAAGDDDDWEEVFEEAAVPESEAAASGPADGEAQALLRAIADLDDSFEAGDIDEADYHARRDELKQRLAAMWNY